MLLLPTRRSDYSFVAEVQAVTQAGAVRRSRRKGALKESGSRKSRECGADGQRWKGQIGTGRREENPLADTSRAVQPLLQGGSEGCSAPPIFLKRQAAGRC